MVPMIMIGPNLPHDTSAATDTTLRASMAREAAAQEASTSHFHRVILFRFLLSFPDVRLN
jgi:hypothetical protein